MKVEEETRLDMERFMCAYGVGGLLCSTEGLKFIKSYLNRFVSFDWYPRSIGSRSVHVCGRFCSDVVSPCSIADNIKTGRRGKGRVG